MECSFCGNTVRWVGPWGQIGQHGTKCDGCGATNSQVPHGGELQEELTCHICGLDGFENQDDFDIHLEDCDVTD